MLTGKHVSRTEFEGFMCSNSCCVLMGAVCARCKLEEDEVSVDLDFQNVQII